MMNENISEVNKTKNQMDINNQKKETNTSKRIIFNPTIYKRHQRYYYVFLCLSILGIIDIATYQIVSTGYGISDTGLISFFIGGILSFISPLIAGVVTYYLSTIFGFVILWIPITIYEYFHLNKLKKAKGDN